MLKRTGGFKAEKCRLHPKASCIACKRTVCAYYSVTRHCDYDGIFIVGHPDCAACFWITDGDGNIFICTRFSVWYFAEFSPYFFLKFRTAQFIWKIKCFAAAVEIFVKADLEQRFAVENAVQVEVRDLDRRRFVYPPTMR